VKREEKFVQSSLLLERRHSNSFMQVTESLDRGTIDCCLRCGKVVAGTSNRLHVWRPAVHGPIYIGSTHRYCTMRERLIAVLRSLMWWRS
jgi:hypothetical protein